MSYGSSDSRRAFLRLFFAVWPREDSRACVQREVAHLRHRFQANWVGPENLHLTLCFLGEVPRTRLDALLALNLALPGSFEVCFDAFRFLRRRRMLWLEPSQRNPVLMRVVGALEERLDELGQARDRRPFNAHLTLARDLRGDFDPGEPSERIRWCVDGVDLVASDRDRTGAHYRSLRHWPLHTTPTGTSVE